MRVVFAGHTGLEKRTVIDNLVDSVLEWMRLSKNLDDHQTKQFLWVRGLEDTVENSLNIPSVVSLLETANPRYAEELWDPAFGRLLDDLEERNPDHAFLLMHLTFRVPGRSPMPYKLDHIRRFRPTHVITLIDDIFEVQARIKEWNVPHSTDYRFSLRELVWWRAQEIGMAAWLAQNLPPAPVERGGPTVPVRHYVVAVKHPPDMLRRLLFEPERPPVYASFPITSTRDDPSTREEIDSIRARLHNSFTVFDPLTIDELSPWVFSEAGSKGEVTLENGEPRCRWPIDEDSTLGRGRRNVYPITLSAREVLEIRGDVEHSIRLRDFGLIDTCKYVIGYRPYYRGNPSQGMWAEFNHAINVCRPPVPLHYYFPAEDKAAPGPFGQFRTRHYTLDEWWRVIEHL